MSNDIVSVFADAISYFNLTNLQIAFESLKLLNIDFDNIPDENGNIGCINCNGCKNCVFCIDCDKCENCQICAGCDKCLDCWYVTDLNGDVEIHSMNCINMRNEPLTDNDKKILIEFVDYVKELLVL